MKVLHIITRMNTGGPAIFLDHLTTAMNNLGVQSTIAYGYCESNETDFTDAHKLSSQLMKIKALHRSLNPWDDLKSFRELKNIISNLKPDVINTHTSKAGVLGRLAAKSVSNEVPVVHTFHGHLIYGYFSRYKTWLFTVIEKYMGKYTDTAVGVTDETRRSLIDLGVGKNLSWEVIQNGIPIENVPVSKTKDGEFRMLWVGRFTDIKNPKFATQVMKLLSQSTEVSFSLTMVGEGELFFSTKQSAKDLPVTFTGWLEEPFNNVGDFDLLLITSKNEGLPLVMLEAANHAKPTISTKVGGVTEFISDNQTGYLVESDPKKMANRIIGIASNKNLCQQVGKNAHKLLIKKFSVDKMANDYKNLYLHLVVGK